MKQLTEEEFRATFGDPMRRADADAAPPFEFWDYFEAIPTADFAGFDCGAGRVEYVYTEPTGRFQHVLVDSNDRDVFLVLVLDLKARVVFGHHLLNLPVLYGLEGESA